MTTTQDNQAKHDSRNLYKFTRENSAFYNKTMPLYQTYHKLTLVFTLGKDVPRNNNPTLVLAVKLTIIIKSCNR